MTQEQQQFLSGYIQGAIDAQHYEFDVVSVDFDKENTEIEAQLETKLNSKLDKDMNVLCGKIEEVIRINDWNFIVYYELKLTIKEEK